MSQRSTRRAVGAAMIIVLMCVACGTSTAPSASPSLSPQSASPSLIAEEATPWQAEVSNLEPDGTRSVGSALKLFAMAFGPIPGVVAEPADVGTVGSASPAVRVVRQLRDQLTDEQRVAVDRYLTPSDDSSTIQVPSAGTPPRVASLQGVTAGGRVAVEDQGYDPDELHWQQVGVQARRAASYYFGEIPDTPAGTPAVSIRTTYAPNEPFLSFFDPTFGPGGFEKCDVFVNRAHANAQRGSTGRSLTLDVVHCYQSWRMSTEQGFDGNVPAWAWEGPAEYIMLEAWPVQEDDFLYWATYLLLPEVSLFERSYDAVGYWAQAREAGIDLSDAFVAVLADVDNPERFALAGTTSGAFLDKWASELLRGSRGEWGEAWSFLGPGLGTSRLHAPQQPMAVSDGSVEAYSQEPYTNHLFVLDASADIVQVSSSGRTRIGDGTVDAVVLGEVAFCVTDKGCGPCPDGSQPSIQATPLAAVSVLAVSGGTDGTNGTVTGHPLEEFCMPTPSPKNDEFCERYRDLLHWWFRDPTTDVGSKPWAAEIVLRFQEMRPLAPASQQAAVDVHIGLYTAHATLSGPAEVKAAVPWAQQMPPAVANLDSYCGIRPADRGASR